MPESDHPPQPLPELEGMPEEERAQILRIRELTVAGRMSPQEAIYQVRREENEELVRRNATNAVEPSDGPERDTALNHDATQEAQPMRRPEFWTDRGGMVPQQEAAMASLRHTREASVPEPERQFDPEQAERALTSYENRSASRESHFYGELKRDHAEAAHEAPPQDLAPEQEHAPNERTLTFFEDRARSGESHEYGQIQREHAALTEEPAKAEAQHQEKQLTFFEDLHPNTRVRGLDLSR